MEATNWTIRDVLQWTTSDFDSRGIPSARLDAELLVAKALGIDRVGLYLDLNRPLVREERSVIRALVSRRRAREPVAYILGYRDFYGRRFEVSSAVLIPRPDTETLVAHALAAIPEETPCRVLDVGTGSGAVALTIAAERPMATVTATDISEGALRVAATNASALGVTDRVRLEHADLLACGAIYDVVVSNPPYVERRQIAELEPEIRDHEPKLALEGGEDGLDVVRALLSAARCVTAEGAHLLIEVGEGQASSVLASVAQNGAWTSPTTHRDFDGKQRVVHLRRT